MTTEIRLTSYQFGIITGYLQRIADALEKIAERKESWYTNTVC